MTGPHVLESRLKTLIQILDAQKRKRRELSSVVAKQAERIRLLERQIRLLKQQLDETGADDAQRRATVQRIKGKIDEAVGRMDRLEEGLDPNDRS